MYLRDMIDACDALAAHITRTTRENLPTDRLVRSAVEREYFIIGEAIIQITKVEPALAARITAAESISRFRNILAHSYDIVDPHRMWDVAQISLPTLRAEAAAILSERDSLA